MEVGWFSAKGGPRMTVRRLVSGVIVGVALSLTGLTTSAAALAAPPSVVATPRPYAVALAPAHSALVSVIPADGSTLDAGPTELVLTFNEDINPRFTQLALSRSGSVITLNAPIVAGPVLRTTLADPGPGAYRIAYRVVSADGHPISGETGFSVRGQATPTPTTSTSPSAGVPSGSPASAAPTPLGSASVAPSPLASAAPSAAGTPPQEGMTWLYLGGGLVALAALTGVWEARRKRR